MNFFLLLGKTIFIKYILRGVYLWGYYEDNINSNSYIEFSKNKSKANLKSEEVDNENKDSQSEDIDNIKQMGVPNSLNKLKKRYNV